MVQPFGKTVWHCLTKGNTHILYEPAILQLGIYKKEIKAS